MFSAWLWILVQLDSHLAQVAIEAPDREDAARFHRISGENRNHAEYEEWQCHTLSESSSR